MPLTRIGQPTRRTSHHHAVLLHGNSGSVGSTTGYKPATPLVMGEMDDTDWGTPAVIVNDSGPSPSDKVPVGKTGVTPTNGVPVAPIDM